MIVLISESLLLRSTATDGRILRDRVLSGFGVRLNARKRTFLVATSVRGQQFRMMLGYWPLMSVDEARSKAMEVLRQCRNGERPSRKVPQSLPTLRVVYVDYCKAKGIKASSQRRYESFFRTHFVAWLDQPVDHMGHGAFAEHCHDFAQNTGKSLVELGRGFPTIPPWHTTSASVALASLAAVWRCCWPASGCAWPWWSKFHRRAKALMCAPTR